MREAFREILTSRELLWQLAYRDLRVRYKQTALGVAWALFSPLLMMIIFTQIFTRVARIDTSGIPYPMFVYCGLLPWQFFAMSLKGCVEALTKNSKLVTKIYMPREVFPLSAIISSFVDFLVASVVLAGMMVWFGVWPTSAIAWLPLVLAVQITFTVGVGLLLSMGNLFFRDVKYVFEVLLLLWMFGTSVVYPIPRTGSWAWLLALNPMTPIIDAYRQILLAGQPPEMLGFTYAAVVSVVLAAIAIRVFHEAEYLFAEFV